MDEHLERVVLPKVIWRLIPFMFLLYIVCYLDRVNIGFAKLQMSADLGFSESMFGLGMGIFFLGYFVFEVPSNLILERVGARLWISRIMISWGVVSCAMLFVKGTTSFYLLRFLLGVAEAGFFPGMILYLTYWFTAKERARAVALFMTAIAVSSVIGGPVSGALLSLDDVAGSIGWPWLIALVNNLSGWQWLFLVEGLPAVILGVVVLAYLPDGPAQARWLTPEEKLWVAARLQVEREQKERRRHYTLIQALSNGKVWVLCLLYFSLMINLYGLTFWLPSIIKRFSGLKNFEVGLLTAIPYLAAAVGMVLWGRHSDRTGERRWHVTGSAFLAAAGFALTCCVESPVLSLVTLSMAAVGILGALGPFWALPTAFLSGTAAAGGIALVNSVGNLGGFVGSYLMGWLRDRTQGYTCGLAVLALTLLVSGFLSLSLRRDHILEAPRHSEK